MGIIVQKVLGGESGKWNVEVLYGDRPLVVTFAGDNVRDLIGKLSFVELSIDAIVSCVTSKERSQISLLPNGNHRLVGEIDGDMELGEGTVLYDLLIEAGPNYLAIDSNELGDVRLKVGDRIALEVRGLAFSPTNV